MLHSAVAKELPQVYVMWTGGVRAVNFDAAQSGNCQESAYSGSNAQKEPRMTVGELRKKLEGIDPETKVVVQWEIDRETTYFDVANVSLRKGTLSRFEGIAEFKFGGDGSPWLFIEVAEA
jgi:hypothetical protein